MHPHRSVYEPLPAQDNEDEDFIELPDSDSQQLLPRPLESDSSTRRRGAGTSRRRAFFIRSLALLCACSLSVGSHYASYILGPLKSRLSRDMGTSNTEFSLLISAFSLNSTWAPLLGGLLASRLGTTFTSILATGIIFLGQLLLLMGDILENVRLMTLGMFIFGLGLSPLSVVQETIIVRFFKSHGLGVSLALGLVAGKGASFISARTSYPLTRMFGPRAPFVVATGLAALSFSVNLIYIMASRWLIDGAGAELEASDIRAEAQRRSLHSVSEAQALEEVAAKHHVHFKEITHLGDVFWAYVGLNVLCGMIWSPFTHLASNIVELRYDLSELDASTQASYLLAGSVLLYPICGFVVDRARNRLTVLHLLTLSSCLTLLCYAWLALPPQWTHTALPGIWSFAIGHGFSPLLLVVIVPQIVPLRFVSTALGTHKSLEQAGSTTFQTLAGWLLDSKTKTHNTRTSIQFLLNAFTVLNILHLCAVIGLFCLYRKHSLDAERVRNSLIHQEEVTRLSLEASKVEETVEEEIGHAGRSASPPGGADSDTLAIPRESGRPRMNSLDPLSSNPCPRYLLPTMSSPDSRRMSKEQRVVKRGEIFAGLCCLFIALTWALFLGTAWLRLRSKQERGGSGSQ